MRLIFFFFGNGYGLKSPYYDQTFYWLVDRLTEKGRFYTFSYGFGSQLYSFEWRCPKPGERRELSIGTATPFNVTKGRFGLMNSISWSLTPVSNPSNSQLDELKKKIDGI